MYLSAPPHGWTFNKIRALFNLISQSLSLSLSFQIHGPILEYSDLYSPVIVLNTEALFGESLSGGLEFCLSSCHQVEYSSGMAEEVPDHQETELVLKKLPLMWKRKKKHRE
ncbi:unnamed protein product [Lactuca saligna]|uniref:Uncharacterized protein n=1 Tax=Lactuca saligna TaxID=75948 RepID=A0AA35YUJ2_LACSI|nr:unnamed protein product [Lactuca saligna]